MVRARRKDHLQNLQRRVGELSGFEINEWANRDYRFRIILPKALWAKVVGKLVKEQDWSNFKAEVARFLGSDQDYNRALHDIWGVMHDLQEGLSGRLTRDHLASDIEDTAAREIDWDGVTRAETLTEEAVQQRQNLADYAKSYDWPRVIELLSSKPKLVNTTRLGGASAFAPLHQAAHGGASTEVVSALLKFGAWRSLKTAKGDRALDIARRKSHTHLIELLEPVFIQHVPADVLEGIQRNFHGLIRGRASNLVEEHSLRLPELGPNLEFPLRRFWFPVPGMYGGFAYWFAYDGKNAKLITESWCRVVGGSGQRHEITARGSTLVEEGFE